MQMESMPGKGTIDPIFSVRQRIEKYGAARSYGISRLGKSIDGVPRKVIWWALRQKGVVEREISTIIERYKNLKTAVRVKGVR